MNWPGIRRDTKSVDGDGFHDLVNVSHYIEGELTRRPGLGNRAVGSAIAMSSFRDTRDNDENWVVKQSASGAITAGKIGSATANSLTTVAAATTPGTFVAFNGVLYFFHPDADGIAIESGDNASLVYSIGIDAPLAVMGDPTKAAGSVSEGRHILRYRYYNSALGYFSNPSDPVTVDVASASEGQLTFTVAAFGGSADIVGTNNTRVDKIIIEMTLAGGDQFYDVALINNGSTSDVVISMNDATLEQQLRRSFGLDTGSAPPPRLSHATIHRGRMFGIDAANPYLLDWSSAGLPEGWDTTSQSRRVFGNTGDIPIAVYSVFEDLYIFGQRSIAKLRYNTEPGLGQLDIIDQSGYGLWSKNCLVTADGIAYGFGRNGAWTIPAGVPRRISRPIDEILTDAIDPVYAQYFHGVFDPDERVITWWYVANGDTVPKNAIRYDIDRRVWSRATYPEGIRSSCTAAGTAGDIVATVSDENVSWSLVQGVFDGVPAGTNAVTLATAGSTSTVINVSPVVSNDLLGAYVTNTRTGESRRIVSSTTTSITVGTAFSSAPNVDDELWIGAFTSTIFPKWASSRGMRNKARPRKFEMSMVASTGEAAGIFQLYQDFSDTAYVYTAGDNDLFSDGVTVTDGSSEIAFDTTGGTNGDGFLSIPMPSGWHRVVRAKVEFRKPQGDMRLLEMSFSAERGDSAAVVDE